jgi:hypothetical protein
MCLTLLQVIGRFGREESTALITHKGGSLAIKVGCSRMLCARFLRFWWR